jgi:hypothetical protein
MDALPECRIRRVDTEFRIAVIGNDCEDRLKAELLNQRFDAPPPLDRGGGTQVIATEKILGRCGNHAIASEAKARTSNFLLQYQR